MRSLNSTYRCCNNAFLLSNCTLKPCKNAPNRDKKNSLAFANETKCLSFCLKLFYFRFGQEFLQKLFYTEILFKSLIQHGATFFLKLFTMYFLFKAKKSLYLSAYWLHSLWHHCQQWKISILSKGWQTYLCMRPIEVSSVAKNAGDVGNLIFRECWGI